MTEKIEKFSGIQHMVFFLVDALSKFTFGRLERVK